MIIAYSSFCRPCGACGLVDCYILIVVRISLLTLFNSVDFTHLFRAGISSIDGNWDVVIPFPLEGEILAEGLNHLQNPFFIDSNSVVSALNALDLSELNKTSRLLAQAINSIPYTLVIEISPTKINGLAYLMLNEVNGRFTNFTIQANNSNVRVHFFVINLIRDRVRLYIQNNGHDNYLELVGVFAYILSQLED